jgi:hypothetical protein
LIRWKDVIGGHSSFDTVRRAREDSIPVNFDRIKRTPEDKSNGADTSYGPTKPQGIEELRLVI